MKERGFSQFQKSPASPAISCNADIGFPQHRFAPILAAFPLGSDNHAPSMGLLGVFFMSDRLLLSQRVSDRILLAAAEAAPLFHAYNRAHSAQTEDAVVSVE